MTLAVVFIGVLGSASAIFLSSYVSVMLAESGTRKTIRQPNELARVVVAVARRARRIFAPRLAVLAAAGTVWRDTVRKLGESADILLIDISVPSEDLLWEVATLRTDNKSRWILIGESERVADVVKQAAAESDTLAGRLVALLDGEEVLSYTVGSRKGLRQFAKALRGNCRRIAQQRRRGRKESAIEA